MARRGRGEGKRESEGIGMVNELVEYLLWEKDSTASDE